MRFAAEAVMASLGAVAPLLKSSCDAGHPSVVVQPVLVETVCHRPSHTV